jgi:hypothetical protein
MRKKIILGTILALSLAITFAVSAVAPALANNKPSNSIICYSNEASVVVQLPPGGGALTGRPTNLQFHPVDYDRRSGGADVLLVSMWVSALNAYVPMAAIADQAADANVKGLWNATPVYLEVNGVVIRNNLKTVSDKELDVWMESAWTYSGCGRNSYSNTVTFMANLTVPVQLDFTGLPSIFGSSFTVPPMTLTFREIGDGFSHEETTLLPSGYTVKTVHTDVPAWVRVTIPSWGTTATEFAGTLLERDTSTLTPPS